MLDGSWMVELGNGNQQSIRQLREKPAQRQAREHTPLEHEALRLLRRIWCAQHELPQKRGRECQPVRIALHQLTRQVVGSLGTELRQLLQASSSSDIGSTQAISRAPDRWARSLMGWGSSSTPKKFGCWRMTAALVALTVCSSFSGSTRPSTPGATRRTS